MSIDIDLDVWVTHKTDVFRTDPYATVQMLRDNAEAMNQLRLLFPNGEVNGMNFVLFSTSGTHGTTDTIEDVEKEVTENGFTFDGLTFMVIKPRLLCVQYGRAYPKDADDFVFLKKLRETSIHAVSCIGQPLVRKPDES